MNCNRLIRGAGNRRISTFRENRDRFEIHSTWMGFEINVQTLHKSLRLLTSVQARGLSNPKKKIVPFLSLMYKKVFVCHMFDTYTQLLDKNVFSIQFSCSSK